ncbi:MAG TPA: hypothetical protein VHK01_08150 [Lacipirellulaceae bacterium]|jgi:hypothetical protein|nr:hypothetical protein [Lacipirellulaceae bacterium]
MRDLLLILMLAPPAIALLGMFLLRMQAGGFLKAVPEIRTRDDLVQFKRLAKIQMYVALVTLPLLWLPTLVWLVGTFLIAEVGWLDLLWYVVLPWMVVVAAASALSGPVERVQKLPAGDPSFQAERDHIVDVWLNRRLPDW